MLMIHWVDVHLHIIYSRFNWNPKVVSPILLQDNVHPLLITKFLIWCEACGNATCTGQVTTDRPIRFHKYHGVDITYATYVNLNKLNKNNVSTLGAN